MTRVFFGAAIAASALLAACGGDKNEPENVAQPAEEKSAINIPDVPEIDVAGIMKKKSDDFLAAEMAKENVRVLESGLMIETLTVGSGEQLMEDDLISFHFTGSLIDGDMFQDTRGEDNIPVVVPSATLPEITSWAQIEVPGLREGFSQMSEGERARVIVPPALAYGDEGIPGAFDPHTVLIYDLELVEVVGPEDETRRAEIAAEQEALIAKVEAAQYAQQLSMELATGTPPQSTMPAEMPKDLAPWEQKMFEASAAAETLKAERFEDLKAAYDKVSALSTQKQTAGDGELPEGFDSQLADAEEAFNMLAYEIGSTQDKLLADAQVEAMALFTAFQEESKLKSAEFLAEQAARDETTQTDTGLVYEVLTDGGDAASPLPTEEVTVHYRGTLPDGTVFDQSYEGETPTDADRPASFFLNRVISGWTEGVALMNPGDTYRFYVPADLGYGPMGNGGDIGPEQVLIFDVYLLDVESAADQGG